MGQKEQAKGMFVVQNDRGLHTRPSTELVKCAAQFQCDLTLSLKEMQVNAKSILGVLMLAARKGSKIKVEARGIDAEAAVESIIGLADQKFNIQY